MSSQQRTVAAVVAATVFAALVSGVYLAARSFAVGLAWVAVILSIVVAVGALQSLSTSDDPGGRVAVGVIAGVLSGGIGLALLLTSPCLSY